MSHQRNRQYRSSRQSYHPQSDMDVDPTDDFQTTMSSRGGGLGQLQEQQRLQATVPPHGLVSPPRPSSVSGSSIRRGPNRTLPTQSAQELNQIGELYSQLDLVQRERDEARREAESAQREIRRLRQELEAERRNHPVQQETPRPPMAVTSSSSSNSQGFFPPNPAVPTFSFTPMPTSVPANTQSSIISNAPPSLTTTTPTTIVNPVSTILQSGSMPPPSSVPSHVAQITPINWEEMRAAQRKENERNRQINELRKRFIAENARKKQKGEEVKYDSWDDYRQAKIDYDEYNNNNNNNNNNNMPNMIPVKWTSPEEVYRPIKRSRTGSIGSSSTEPSLSGSSDRIIPQVTSALPRTQEEADLYFTQADEGNTSAQSALNKCIVEYNRLRKGGHRPSHVLEYVMNVFNHMVMAPLWRRNDARQ